MTELKSTSLNAANDNVVIPTYDRASTIPGIVHFGLGGFSRAHLAMYVDRLLNRGDADEWAVSGVGLMPLDEKMRDTLAAQDRLYTLITRASDGEPDAHIIGSIAEYLYAPDDPEAVIERLAAPTTRIVTLTVTEAGYSPVNPADIDIPADGDSRGTRSESDAAPTTVWGYLLAGLMRRAERGIPPFTVLSCDNIQGNGSIARAALVSYARAVDFDWADRIVTDVAFPNSMVDRITPATTADDIDTVERITGLRDAWPVSSERFEQWVIEDNFPAGRPAFESVGAQFVADVAPYEKMKLRLLNASHQAMSYLGILEGFSFVHDVVRDDDFAAFLRGYMREEAAPTLDAVAGIDLAAYQEDLIARFSNHAIKDTLARQVVDGSDRIPKFLLPVIVDQIQAGGDAQRCALVLAAWQAVLLRGAIHPEDRAITSDNRLDELEAAALADEEQPGAFLARLPMRDIHDERFTRAYLRSRVELRELGPRGAVLSANRRAMR